MFWKKVLANKFNLRGTIVGGQIILFIEGVRNLYCTTGLNYWGKKIKEDKLCKFCSMQLKKHNITN